MKNLFLTRMDRPLCGYLSTIYYHDISTTEQFNTFILEYNRADIVYKTWSSYRKARSNHLLHPARYVNNSANNERDNFLRYFSLRNFAALTEEERTQHKFLDCKKCQQTHGGHLLLRKGNNVGTAAPPPTPKSAKCVLQEVIENTPDNGKLSLTECKSVQGVELLLKESDAPDLRSFLPKRKQNNENMVTKHAKRQIIKESRDQREQDQTKKDFLAHYSCNQSNSEYIKQRKLTYGHYRENPKKSHIANLNTYGFRREKLLAILSDTPNVNTLNFAQVAREISLVRDDKLPGNSSQVSLLRNCFLLHLLQCITICAYPLISLCLGYR